jgi:hypothetical protein
MNPYDQDPILKYFTSEHLPKELKEVSDLFADVAHKVCTICHAGRERSVALRKLLEGKDAAVRAKVMYDESPKGD